MSLLPKGRKELLDGALAVAVTLLTALLYAVAFPPLDLPETAYLWAVPYLIWVMWRQPSWRLTLAVAGAAQFASWIVLLRWLRHFPEHSGMTGAAFVGWGAMLLLALVVALFGTAWLLAARWALPPCRRGPLALRLLVMLGLAALWVSLEWLRSTILTGFPWLPLSASQWQRPLLLQLAASTGAWGLSFILMLFNLGLVFYLRTFLATRRMAWWKRFSPEFYLALGGLLGTVALGFADTRQSVPQRMFSAGFVQGAVSPRERWNREQVEDLLDLYRTLAQFAVWDGAEVILWPEASTPLPAPGNAYAERWLTGLSRELEVPILLGSLVAVRDAEEEPRYYNAVVKVEPEAGIDPRFYAKRHLVPFGEYVPGWLPFLDKVVPLEGTLSAGRDPVVLELDAGGQRWLVGALICYEDLFPNLPRAQVRQGASFLFVVTNDIWYGREGAAYQHAAHSVLRAVETRRPVLRSGNEGWSGWIDERGTIRHVLRGADNTIYFQGADAEPVYVDPRYRGTITTYVRYGDWFVWVCLAGSALAGLVRWRWSGAGAA